MDKRKRTNNDLHNTTQKTKDRATPNPLNTGGELRCSGRTSNANTFTFNFYIILAHLCKFPNQNALTVYIFAVYSYFF